MYLFHYVYVVEKLRPVIILIQPFYRVSFLLKWFFHKNLDFYFVFSDFYRRLVRCVFVIVLCDVWFVSF